MWRLALLAAAFLLSGCFASDLLLLDQTAAVQPVKAGVYAKSGNENTAVRLQPQGNGSYLVSFKDGDSWDTPQPMWMDALGSVNGRPTYALAQFDPDQKKWTYAVAYQDGANIYEAAPDCGDDIDVTLAKAHGARVNDPSDGSNLCVFKDAAALKAALSAFAARTDFGPPFQRTGD